jgi:UTP--glucose-1-phosphate uridylyltransferase
VDDERGSQVLTAVIPAAGLGTRLLPATKVLPKELLPLVDTPVIELAVQEAAAAGIRDVLVITSRGKELLADHFDHQPELETQLLARNKFALLDTVRATAHGVRLHYTRQSEPLGLGHAVLQAETHVGPHPFAVMLPDDVMLGRRAVLAQLLDYWEPGRSVVAVTRVPRSEAGRYGVVSGPDGEAPFAFPVRSIVEKPDPEDAPDPCWAVMGRYVLDGAVFDILSDTHPGAGGEIQLTDALAELAGRGRLWAVAYEGQRFDMGDKLGYVKALIDYALGRPDMGAQVRGFLRQLADAGRF